MDINNFFEKIKGTKIDILYNVSENVFNRLKKYNFIINSVDLHDIELYKKSKTLLIDFNKINFSNIIDNFFKLNRKYKKIIILNLKICNEDNKKYIRLLSTLSKNCIVEVLDMYSYNISNANGSHITVLNNDESNNTQLEYYDYEDIDLTGKVSVICACMNRNKILRININSWLNFSEIGEIVIVDWSSEESLNDLVNIDPRIKVIRVENQKYFNISQAFNLALDNSTLEYVIKLDTDYFLNPYYNFFKNNPPIKNGFYSGSWSYSITNEKPEPIFKHLCGLCFAKREDLLDINGYNEYFTGYGYDDTDLYNRLIIRGLNRILIKYDYSIMHIPHESVYRFANYKSGISDGNNNKFISQIKGLKPKRVKKWKFEYSAHPQLIYAYETSNDL